MSIRKRTSKKAKNGYVYEVYFNYKTNGITNRYTKSGFKTKKVSCSIFILFCFIFKRNFWSLLFNVSKYSNSSSSCSFIWNNK